MKTNLSVTICGLAALLLSFSSLVFAQQPVIPLYTGVAPGSEDARQKEWEVVSPTDKQKRIRNVTTPTLTVFLPDRARANGTAIIIAPGGGFMHLAWEKEGIDVAKWLRERGVAAFVLKYRLLDTGPTEDSYQKRSAELARGGAENTDRQKAVEQASADGRQAIKLVRARAREWGIEPDRIGLMGFSAGGILTMGVVMRHDAESRPNFAAPIYGGSANGELIPADAPPLFIAVADDDRAFSASSAKLYLDWKAAGRAAELHIYSKGGHGFGMSRRGLPVDSWIDRFGDWLQAQGLLKAQGAN
jgi:acetyl esterase/lipase